MTSPADAAVGATSRSLIGELLADVADPGQVIDVPSGLHEVPASCILARLDIKLVQVGRRFARSLSPVTTMHLNQRGDVQGGIYGVLADATAGWATEAFLLGPRYVTTGFSGQLLGAARLGDTIRTEAQVVHPGRRTVVATVELWRDHDREDSRRIALFTCHQLVVARGD